MSLDVIGVGFLRTGTTSLMLALERLGYGPCYHMRVLNGEPWRAEDWAEAARNPEAAEWERIFAGYRSSVGSPGTAFWRHLVDAYPAAKVILTVREPETWYESAAGTIGRALTSAPRFRLPWRRAAALDEVQHLVRDREGGRFADRDRAVAAFRGHTDAVRTHVAAERLLVFEVRDGWEPLCAFLGVPVPDEPFPKANERAAFQARQARARARTTRRRVAAAAGAMAGAGLAIWAVGRGVRAGRG
ncbi:sulfotransferase family protein [Catenuloplanes indicus]|uniref:Sulfotransferase family protein n=1 Tax=Catenuloplanes indicus TaxID=137267 RepID=A0AAE3W089_9ACTN|nr:sulfotransferase family protein [Catenuloplanes indicus]MDQ0367253.1 hypothetical protein [Catenuloplanes indicus]